MADNKSRLQDLKDKEARGEALNEAEKAEKANLEKEGAGTAQPTSSEKSE